MIAGLAFKFSSEGTVATTTLVRVPKRLRNKIVRIQNDEKEEEREMRIAMQFSKSQTNKGSTRAFRSSKPARPYI
jgi:hypothetical protein